MRWTASAGLLVVALFVLGCGEGGDSSATAGAGSPPPAGGPPGGPPAPGGDAPPAETPPEGENPPPGETPPPSESPPPGGEGEGSPAAEPPPDQVPLPGGEPGGGSIDGGGQPSDPNNPNGDPNNPNPENTPRRPPPPRTLRDQAYAAFRGGSDVIGHKLLNAHFAVVPAAKKELNQKMAWVPGLMRPALTPRIGIGVFYENVPLQFKGNPMPIGSPELTTIVDSLQQSTAGDNQVGGNRRAGKIGNPTKDFSERSKGDPNDSLPASQQLDHYLGDFGHMFLDALLDRMDSGEYGPIMQELMQQASRPIQRGSGIGPDGQPIGGDPNGGDPNGGEFGGADGQPGFGQPGGGRGGSASGRGSALAGTTGLPGTSEETETFKRRFTSRATEKELLLISSVKQLNPCIIWLGKTEERDDLVKRAEATSCDVIAIFHITLREARASSLINNTTILKMQYYRPSNPGSKWPYLPNFTAEPLINLTVETWRQKEEKGIDPVEKEVTKAVEALDKALKPVPLPEAVTAERAKKRIADLVAQKPEDMLPIIVEARFYASKGLMTEEEYVETAKSLLGDSGFEKLKARAKVGEKE